MRRIPRRAGCGSIQRVCFESVHGSRQNSGRPNTTIGNADVNRRREFVADGIDCRSPMNDKDDMAKPDPCGPCDAPPPALVPDTADADAALAALAWAVAHPVRVRILRILAARNACVCGEIVDELPVSQSTVSQHLKILKDAGLVRGEIDGPKVCYCIDPAGLKRLVQLAAGL